MEVEVKLESIPKRVERQGKERETGDPSLIMCVYVHVDVSGAFFNILINNISPTRN